MNCCEKRSIFLFLKNTGKYEFRDSAILFFGMFVANYEFLFNELKTL